NRWILAKVATQGSDRTDPLWDPHLASFSRVYALAASGANLYVGGFLWPGIGGQNRSSLAKIATSRRAPADPEWVADTDGYVYSLALSGTNLYVGGGFTSVQGVAITNLAKVSAQARGALDTNWMASILLSCPNCGTYDGAVRALAIVETNLFIGGDFTNIGGLARQHLAKVSA